MPTGRDATTSESLLQVRGHRECRGVLCGGPVITVRRCGIAASESGFLPRLTRAWRPDKYILCSSCSEHLISPNLSPGGFQGSGLDGWKLCHVSSVNQI